MDWSESLYEHYYSEKCAERIRSALIVLVLLIAATIWIQDESRSGGMVSSNAAAGVREGIVSAMRTENTVSGEETPTEERVTAAPAVAEAPLPKTAANPLLSLPNRSAAAVTSVPDVSLAIAPGISMDIKPLTPDASADIAPSVPDAPVDTAPSVPDAPVDTAPSVPDVPVDIAPSVPNVPVDTAPSVPDTPVDTLPLVPDESEDILPAVPDVPADEEASEPVVPSVPNETLPDQSVPGGEEEEPAVPGTVDGFYVNEAGMITGIADPSVVSDGYMELPSEGCSGISSGAFLSAPAGIREIYIPANITYIEEGAFVGLNEMEWYEKASSGGYYSADGVLYSEGGTCVLAFPPARTGTCNLPAQVTRFAWDAFAAAQIEIVDAFGCNITDTGNLPEHIQLITAI